MTDPNKNSDNKKQSGRWASDQHQRFLAAIATHGKDWKKVQQIVGTRSGSQVRSHAQKFFNKLLKDQNKKEVDGKMKKHEKYVEDEDKESQHYFMKYIHDDGSIITPIQLVSLIKKESQQNTSNKVNIQDFQKKLEQKMSTISQQNEENAQNSNKQNSFQGMNNILKAYQQIAQDNKNQELEDQSFLLKLARHYKRFFVKGGKFQNLIDFGSAHNLQHIEDQTRKRSFTLPQGLQQDQQELNERKKRLITTQQTSKFSEKQKQEFQQKITKLAQQEKNQQRANQRKNTNNE